jgi:RNA polymerase sigma factor (TIGR02999 family)
MTTMSCMSDVTRILSQIDSGDPRAAEQLLPLVYDELRKLAAARLAHEKPGQTLQATALVHEAYLRLVGGQEPGIGGQESRNWDSRGHFFAAVAEAMRRILVDRARQKQSQKQGSGRERLSLDDLTIVGPEPDERILAVSEALDELAANDKTAADFVKLRYFAGLSGKDAAAALGIADRTADRLWVYARSWLLKRLRDE